MKLLLLSYALSYACHALVQPPRRIIGRPTAPRFAPPNKVAIPLEGTYAVSSEQKEVPFPHTKLGIGLIVTALVLQSAGASLLARRVALRHSYDGAVAGLLQEARDGAVVAVAQRDASCQKRRARTLEHQSGHN